MRGIIVRRKWARRDAQRDTGTLTGVDRSFTAQVRLLGIGDAEIMQLPAFLSDSETQTANGSLIFMVDLDALDGSNGLG